MYSERLYSQVLLSLLSVSLSEREFNRGYSKGETLSESLSLSPYSLSLHTESLSLSLSSLSNFSLHYLESLSPTLSSLPRTTEALSVREFNSSYSKRETLNESLSLTHYQVTLSLPSVSLSLQLLLNQHTNTLRQSLSLCYSITT